MNSFEITQIAMSYFTSLGFGILFNIHGRRLLLVGLGGMLGWAIYLVFYRITGMEPFSYGIATVCTTLYSQAMARVVKTPATLFLVPSVVPMLPGGYLYYAMLNAVSGNWDMFLDRGALTLASAAAIAIGMVAGTSLFSTFMALRHAYRDKGSSDA